MYRLKINYCSYRNSEAVNYLEKRNLGKMRVRQWPLKLDEWRRSKPTI